MRVIGFCLLLGFLWIPALFIMASISDVWGLGELFHGESIAITIAQTAPVIAEDISLFGELSPFMIAGLLTVLAPKKDEKLLIGVSLAICSVGWLIYLALTVFIQDGSTYGEVLETILETAPTQGHSQTAPNAPASNLGVLQGFATGCRVFYIVVGASLLGISIRKER